MLQALNIWGGKLKLGGVNPRATCINHLYIICTYIIITITVNMRFVGLISLVIVRL